MSMSVLAKIEVQVCSGGVCVFCVCVLCVWFVCVCVCMCVCEIRKCSVLTLASVEGRTQKTISVQDAVESTFM